MRALAVAIGIAIAALGATATPQSASAASGCNETIAAVTGCVVGDAVNLVGEETTPGSGGGSSGGSGAGGAPAEPSRPPEDRLSLRVCERVASVEECLGRAEAGELEITISDLASFRPTPGTQRMEPDGWAVAGLSTNFYAITGSHVVDGTLLGRPAAVRFTPVAFHWDYGDGTRVTAATMGGTWASLGIPEFEPTPTSHVYQQIGDYTITLRIAFAAEYRFDGGAWRSVTGTITLPANDLHIRVGSAQTVLVDRDCLVDPSGPGC